MSSFRLRRLLGGSLLRGASPRLRGDDSLLEAATADVQADASGDLLTQIAMAGDAAAQADASGDLLALIAVAGDAQAVADAGGTLSDYIVPAPIAHTKRDYEQFLRGPMSGVLYRFGTIEDYRGGAWHTANISAFTEPQENALSEFGIQQGGTFTVDLVSNAEAQVDLVGVGGALRNQECELELLTILRAASGAVVQEISNVRRAVVKRAVQRMNVLTLFLADVDRSALEKVFPFETFTVEDWPELFVDHVGRRVAQGVGTVPHVPLTWVKKTGGLFKFAGPKVIGTPGAALTVYRGDRPGEGAIVDPSEYTVSTMAAAVTAGLSVVTVEFVKEQTDNRGRPYVLEADFQLPGSRAASDEVARILTAFGIGVDAASFADAGAYDLANGFLVDPLYGGDNGRTGNGILGDLLQVARGWLVPTATPALGIAQDRPKLPILDVDVAQNQAKVEEYGDEEIEKTVTIDYRPRLWEGTPDYEGHLQRTTNGVVGEKTLKLPYVRQHDVADRLLSYHQKRRNTLKRAKMSVHAVQLGPANWITVRDLMHWAGPKSFMLESVSRPADANDVVGREVDLAVYLYTPGTLPAGATNVYGPDYSFTRPLAPTGVTLASQGTASDTDGKTMAFALIRATPPAVNWALMRAFITDTSTNEVHSEQLRLNAGNYEATIPGLRPNRDHNVVVTAYNANNIEGFSSAPVTFTSANYTTGPAAPTGVAIAQTHSFEVEVTWNRVADVAGAPKVRHYIPFVKVGAGAFVEKPAVAAGILKIPGVAHLVALQVKIRSEDMNGNQSVDSSTVSITPNKKIDDTHVTGGGISGVSIADDSINRTRSRTGLGSAAGTIVLGGSVSILMETYTFFPGVSVDTGANPSYMKAVPGAIGNDAGFFSLTNQGLTDDSYNVRWRNVLD